MLTGGCACRAIRYEYDGPLLLSYKCHCLDCQAASGGGHAALSWARMGEFSFVRGRPKFHRGVGSSGKEVARGFCGTCGAPIVALLGVLPGILGILASSLDEPAAFQPRYEIWTSRARPWDVLDPALERLEGNFPAEIARRYLVGQQPSG